MSPIPLRHSQSRPTTDAVALALMAAVFGACAAGSYANAGETAARAWTATVQRGDPEGPGRRPVAVGRWATVVAARQAVAQRPGTATTTGSLGARKVRSHVLDGIASYYWQDQMTASGERFDKRALTAAHKTLPLGTRVRVTEVSSGRQVVVRINDRGPFKPGRVIDLSERAAEVIGMTAKGLTKVRVEVLR